MTNRCFLNVASLFTCEKFFKKAQILFSNGPVVNLSNPTDFSGVNPSLDQM